MKRALITIAMLTAIVASMSAQDKTYKRTGDTFSAVPYDNAKPMKGDQVTAYLWQDSKGDKYPIILHTYTKGEKVGRTTAYIIRTSEKTGNKYRYFLPQGEKIAEEIIKENQ